MGQQQHQHHQRRRHGNLTGKRVEENERGGPRVKE
jgi:hypothetical protein